MLERLLAERRDVEVLSLGVNGHQSEDVLAVIQDFVPRLVPDLVIYGVSHNDLLPAGLDQRIDVSYALPLSPRVKSFFVERSRVLHLAQTAYDKTLLGLGLRAGFYDQISDQWEAYQARFAADAKAMNELVISSGLPAVVALVLDQNPFRESKGHAVSMHLEEQLRAAGMEVVSSAPFYSAFHGERFPASKWEGHPNEVANIIRATMLARYLETHYAI